MESRKVSTDEPIHRAAMEMKTQRTGLQTWQGGQEGLQTWQGGTNRKSSMETYILTYVKEITSGNYLYDSGNSNPGSVTTERGEEWGGMWKRGSKGSGTYVYL